MPRRQGNNPKRRIAREAEATPEYLAWLSGQVRYTGSPHHKRIPVDYGFDKPASPRPNKSLCDANRCVVADEAQALFDDAISRGMISNYCLGEFPKYVWAVDDEERVYEAKVERGSNSYHGCELGEDEDAMRQLVIEEWKLRCPVT